MLSLVAALDRNNAIGKAGALPWHLPDDLKRFKQLTLGKPVLMGRKTAQSIGRPLPGRLNLILTLSRNAPFHADNVVAVRSIEEALAHAGASELMVIGGGEVYRQTIDVADRLYLTEVDTVIDGADAFFPLFDRGNPWRGAAPVVHAADEKHEYSFSFVDYVRQP